MFLNLKKNKTNDNKLYNKILLLSRNKLLYLKFNVSDTFANRINLIFLHISFLFVKLKLEKNVVFYKSFNQKIFDLMFNSIEINMREIGYGDTNINKSMKILVKSFYNILLYCEKYKTMSSKDKEIFFNDYLTFNNAEKNAHISDLIDYFNHYQAFCFDLNSDSVLRGDLNFKYK